MITTSDFLRYNRQMNLNEIGVIGQLAIKNAKVLVIGAGGLGSPILTYLASCGIGHLAVVDFDKVEHHNLHRQILYTEQDIHEYKTISAKQKIEQLNPHIKFEIYTEKLTVHTSSHIIEQYDIIIDGSDNFETRYLVNDTCVNCNKVLVYGSILGFKGQIAVFNHHGSKDLRSLFSEPPAKEDVPSCSINGVLGTLPGIIGTIMAQEALKVILDLPTLTNTILLLDTLTWEINKITY